MRIVMSASGNGAGQFQLAAFQLLIHNAHFEQEVAHLPPARRLAPRESAPIVACGGSEGDFESRVKATIAMTSQAKATILVNMRVIVLLPLLRHSQPSPIYA